MLSDMKRAVYATRKIVEMQTQTDTPLIHILEAEKKAN